MNDDAPEIKNEIEDATEDLRDALNEVNDRVGEGIARVESGFANLNPQRSIQRRPMAAACLAGAVGATFGSRTLQASILGLALFGVAVALIAKDGIVEEE